MKLNFALLRLKKLAGDEKQGFKKPAQKKNQKTPKTILRKS